MKIKPLFAIMVIMGILCWGTTSLGAENEPVTLPSAILPDAQHEFGAVVEGTVVTHDFILQNKGTALLEIKKVRTA